MSTYLIEVTNFRTKGETLDLYYHCLKVDNRMEIQMLSGYPHTQKPPSSRSKSSERDDGKCIPIIHGSEKRLEYDH